MKYQTCKRSPGEYDHRVPACSTKVTALEQSLEVNTAAEAMALMQSAGDRGAIPHTGKRAQQTVDVVGFATSVLSVPAQR